MEFEPAKTFRGLPLTPEQDSEIRHYIHRKQRDGEPWQTAELHAMLDDMLDPPEHEDEDQHSLSGSMRSEQAAAEHDEQSDQDKPGA